MPTVPLIGIAEAGVTHTTPNEFDLDTRFRMVREAGVFDYYDKTPPPGEAELYRACIARYELPLLAGTFYYVLGRDEPLLEWHLRWGREFGTRIQDVQIMTHDVSGVPVSDERVCDAYCRAAELGERTGVLPCLEVHVNMWSEHFGRVARVGELVERRGVAFRLTLDASHVIFKLDNPAEQAIQEMDIDIAAGRLELDPAKPGNVCERWIDANWIWHAHARSAAPGGPRNIWAKRADGQPGRGIQYPFVEPAPGEWHGQWRAEALDNWRQVMRKLLRHHARDPASPLASISTEFIPAPDYGGGARYSQFAQNVACAVWLRQEWTEALAEARTA